MSMHEYAVQCYTLSGGQELPQQTGHDLPTSSLYGAFAAKDGNVVIAAQADDAWARLAQLLGGEALDDKFKTMVGRNAHRLAMLPLVRAWTAQKSVSDVLKTLDAADVPSAKIQGIDDVVNDPQIIARGMLVEQDHPVAGRIRLPNVPFKFSGFDATITEPAPLLGQHNREIAQSLGFSAQDIDAMQRDGVLFSKN